MLRVVASLSSLRCRFAVVASLSLRCRFAVVASPSLRCRFAVVALLGLFRVGSLLRAQLSPNPGRGWHVDGEKSSKLYASVFAAVMSHPTSFVTAVKGPFAKILAQK